MIVDAKKEYHVATKKWLGLAAITAAIGSAVALVFGKKRKAEDDPNAEKTTEMDSHPGEEE
ncbi:MAG: hypothetical protein WBM90_02220 [Acidimicrobiia bacterium]